MKGSMRQGGGRSRAMGPSTGLAVVLLLVSCEGEPTLESRHRIDGATAFLDAPFPAAHREDDGSIAMAGFPNERESDAIAQLITLLGESRQGFAPNGAVFLPFDGALDLTTLPDVDGSTMAESSVVMVDIDPSSPDRGRRIPLEVKQTDATQTYAPEHTLVALPFAGVTPRAETLHAVYVTDDVVGAEGERVAADRTLRRLLAGEPVEARADDAFATFRTWLEGEGIDPGAIIAATVFRTGDPFSELGEWRDAVAAMPSPAFESARVDEVFDELCVIAGEVELPIFQQGPKPYRDFPSGAIVVEDGVPQLQETDRTTVYLSVPRTAMPEDGFPIVLYANGSGGLGRQFVDRTAIGLESTGEGPALHYARQGLAAIGFPAPLSHERHPEGMEGTTSFWNVANLAAFRGNLQQAALDYTTVIGLLKSLSLEGELCAEAGESIGFDEARIYMQGHSTGGTIASTVIPLEPDIRAGILSGTGGGWISNVVTADSPFPLAMAAGIFLRLPRSDAVEHHDLEMTLLQTLLSSVEVMSWGRVTAADPRPGIEPKSVLFLGGIVDTYHYPRNIHGQGMALRAPMVLPTPSESWEPEYARVGLGSVTPPVSANVGSATVATFLARQREGVDGHYVPFELEWMKRVYSCFLGTHARTGTAVVHSAEVSADCVEP